MGMKRKRPGTYVLVALLLVIAVGITASIQRKRTAVTFNTARVERGTVTSSVTGTGILEPLTTVAVKSNVGGQLVYLNAEEGDHIRAGEVIAKIDPADAQSNLDQSSADLESSHSKVEQAQQGLKMQRDQNSAQLSSSEQAVEAARLRLLQAKKESALQQTITANSIEQAQQNLAAVQARLQQAEELAKLQPKLTEIAIVQAKSNLASATNSYQQMKTSLIPQKIAAAQSALDQAVANCTYTKNEMLRLQQLLKQGFVARSDAEAAEQQFQVAQAQRESAQKKVETLTEETHDDLANAQSGIDQAQSALNTAEANRAQDAVKQHDVLAAQASEKQAEAAVQAAIANRMQDAIKADEVASAEAAFKQAEAALANTRANAYQMVIKQGDITQASAQVKRTAASVSNARTQLNYTTITAPRTGVVVKKYIEKGSIITGARNMMGDSGSGVTLLDLADVSRMYALVNIDETDIAKITVGQAVDVTVDAFPDDLYLGKVTKIAPRTMTSQNVTTIAITVEVEAPDLRLKPGMNATCDFTVSRHSNVLLVPKAAIKHTANGTAVIVLDHGRPIMRPVQLGLTNNRMTEITDGVQEGELVVTSINDPSEPGATTSGGTKRTTVGGGGGPSGPGGGGPSGPGGGPESGGGPGGGAQSPPPF